MHYRRKNLSVAFLVAVLGVVIQPGSACAFEVNPNNTVPGVVANSLIVNGNGGDWNVAELLLELDAGSVYNDADSDSIMSQQNLWFLSPDLEFDSWIGIPGDLSNSILGPAADLGDNGPVVMADQKISVTWFNTDLTNTASLRIANVSLSDDAQGTWTVIVGFSGAVLLSESGWVVNGVMTLTPPPLTGDLDGDGFVGISDLNIVLGDWNQSVPPGNPQADSSGDGFVGIEDLNVVLGNWNAGSPGSPPLATVPEPATSAIIATSVFTLLRRRVR